MSTPTETTTPTTRKRNLGIGLQDEEQAIGHDAPAPKVLSPGTESSRRRRLQELTLQFEENKEELIKFWDQFTRKGKKKVDVVESLRALFFSSCMLLLNDGGVHYELNFISYTRAQHPSDFYTHSMGLQISRVEFKSYLHSYVLAGASLNQSKSYQSLFLRNCPPRTFVRLWGRSNGILFGKGLG
jgi:hypothetical protein